MPEVHQGSGDGRAMAPEDPAFDLEARSFHSVLDERSALGRARLVEGTRGLRRRRLVFIGAVRSRRRETARRGGKENPRRLGLLDTEKQGAEGECEWRGREHAKKPTASGVEARHGHAEIQARPSIGSRQFLAKCSDPGVGSGGFLGRIDERTRLRMDPGTRARAARRKEPGSGPARGEKPPVTTRSELHYNVPMLLSPGRPLGPYEILAPIGAGGMGEVYRARDTRLSRDVAIKGLPEAFASNPDRLARFRREAQALAALNHPNIATIYGLEEVSGFVYLILELVDGETLAAMLERGALPLRETLTIGPQIAAAIEAAHDRGVIHRDLKPGNVMVTRGGLAKVLDFGLAKFDPAAAGYSSFVTLTDAGSGTAAGTSVGTAAYMSPEQARGKPVDRRSDIWSFGCVLYECLTGRSAFVGDTVSDLIAGILEREPDWTALPQGTPA